MIDGKILAEKRRQLLKRYIKEIGGTPRLVIFLDNCDKRSATYVDRKVNVAKEVGICANVVRLDSNDTSLHEVITDQVKSATGAIIQLPMTVDDTQYLLDQIPPEKDVDGISSYNFNLLRAKKKPLFIPATSRGVVTLLLENNIEIKNKTIVVLGKSRLVGMPTAFILEQYGAEVIAFDSTSPESVKKNAIQSADVLVTATGVPHLVTKKSVHKDLVIIDVGITYENNRVMGDVHPEVYGLVKNYTPVPGGVGPMTVQSLLENVVIAYARQKDLTFPEWLRV
jgi:methylenetetrahydrofolate dehydrogenase (NADP+)/methenyltetrahydrofolate cyclohydrolase